MRLNRDQLRKMQLQGLLWELNSLPLEGLQIQFPAGGLGVAFFATGLSWVSKCISLRHRIYYTLFKISFVQNNILVTYNFIYYVATCNFDMDACGWRNTFIGDDFNWTRHKGYTPSFDTGPSTDHTSKAKSGNFTCIVDQNREMIRPTLKTC